MVAGNKDHYFRPPQPGSLQELAQRIGEMIDWGVGRDGPEHSVLLNGNVWTEEKRRSLLGLGMPDRYEELKGELNPKQRELVDALREWWRLYWVTPEGERKDYASIRRAMGVLGLEDGMGQPVNKEDLALPNMATGIRRGRVVEE